MSLLKNETSLDVLINQLSLEKKMLHMTTKSFIVIDLVETFNFFFYIIARSH